MCLCSPHSRIASVICHGEIPGGSIVSVNRKAQNRNYHVSNSVLFCGCMLSGLQAGV